MIEKILDLSVRNRWFIVLLTAVACALGVWSLNKLPIDAVPDVTNNQVQINAIAPALTPVEMEKQITFQIENILAGTPTLEYTRSFSRNGFAQVTAVFRDKTSIYFARQQVNERLQEIRQSLPPEAEVKLGPISTGLGEVYWWAVEYQKPPKDTPVADGKPGWQSDGSYLTPEGRHLRNDFERAVYLRTVQDWIIRPQMRTVPGVAGADAIGGYVKQYQIAPDPAKSIAYGISFADIVKAVEANNASRGANYVERNGENYVVRAAGRIEDISEIGEIVVATRGDTPLRVKDLAEVSIGRELRTGSASLDGHEAVLGTALMLVGGNSRTVSAAAAAKIEAINKALPPGIVAKTLLNRTQLVDATITTVAKNLAEGALLVVVILFALLGNFRAALITALVIPAAMLLTVSGMLQAKVSANLMSLGAIDFGLIVDGAVIITENCLRHLANRQHQLGRQLDLPERLETVRLAAKEMVAPSVYGQAVIMLVYIPLLTFSGVEGKMFEPMALTVIIALLAAFVLSLTFVPAMIAIAVTGRVQEKPNRLVRGLADLYRSALTRSLKVPGLVLGVGAAAFALSVMVFLSLGQEFNPTLDEKNLVIEARRIPSTSLAQSQAMQLDLEQAVSKFREVAFVFSRVGTPDIAADPMPPNAADTYVVLKPQEEWPDPSLTKAELIERMEPELQKLVGTSFSFSQPIQMRFNELIAGVREDIAVKIFGDEFEPMLKSANEVAGVLRGIHGAQDVRVEQVTGLPFVEIGIDKKEISRRGLSIAAVQDVIGTAIGGREAGLVFEGDRRFRIVVRLSGCAARQCRRDSRPSGAAAGRGRGAVAHDDSPARRGLADVHGGAQPGQPRKRKAPRRGDGECARPGHRLGGARSPGEDFARRKAAVRILDRLGRTVREPRLGARAPDHRGAGLLCDDLSDPVRGAGLRARRAAGVQRGAARAVGRHRGALAARHAVLGLGRGGLHRPVRRRRAQRAGDADLHQAAHRARPASAGGDHRGRGHDG